MQRIEEVERERDTYRELLQLALAQLATLTAVCKRQRDWNREMVQAAGIAREEARAA